MLEKECCREVLQRSVGEECCGGGLCLINCLRRFGEKSGVERRCREVLPKSIVPKGSVENSCRKVLRRSVGEECCSEVLEKSLVEKCLGML